MKTLTKDTAIALLMGGPGSERQVSLVSGNAVLEALQQEGFTNVTPVIVESERPFVLVTLCGNPGFYEQGALNVMARIASMVYETENSLGSLEDALGENKAAETSTDTSIAAKENRS